ncbi:MAG: biopolymer transporter ExbD [Burkholderiales bacterium]|nr:biopolymer transporter ExbD [Burkholderiales bacterium]
MNFRGDFKEDPEINLIPMIDVLLVIVIFLVVTTTYAKFAELQISLPSAQAQQPAERPNEINVTVSAGGQYTIEGRPMAFADANAFAAAMTAAGAGRKDPVIVINADANAPHQSVIRVMEAARLAGFGQVSFAVESPAR